MTAHAYKKRGTWQIALVFEDAKGQRRQKWVNTELLIRGNQRRAEAMIPDLIKEWQPILESHSKKADLGQMLDNHVMKQESYTNSKKESGELFSEYLATWVETKRHTVQETTFGGYQKDILHYIAPYFAGREILIEDLRAQHIEDFYSFKRKQKVSDNTLLHYKTLLNQALNKAVKKGLLQFNPMTQIDPEYKPRKKAFIPTVYSTKDVEKLFNAMVGDPIALIILMDITYGLRRSELLGLRWSAIDFDGKSFLVSYKVTNTMIDGKFVTIKTEIMKNKTSRRSLPLVPELNDELLRLRTRQLQAQELFKSSYCQEYSDFVFVNHLGVLLNPGYVSDRFRALIKQHHLKKIRFHDLRHTCATMLRRKNISLQEIQMWLEHSTYHTTADLYTHLCFEDKLHTANAASQLALMANVNTTMASQSAPL